MKHLFVLTVAIAATLIGCNKVDLSESGTWGFYVPEGFPEPVYKLENNAQSTDRFELGRVLFYDPILSSDNTISCASCHAQVHGFADHNSTFSAGVGGATGTRNSPTIVNMAWAKSFMWDGGVNHIEIFSLAPITNPVEMNETMPNVLAKLNASERYTRLFQKAYGTSEITDQLLFRALSQYMMMIISDQSKYDQYRKGTASFTTSEKNGLALFREKCASCHQEPLFTDNTFRNNGIDEVFDADPGRYLITQNQQDKGKFKVPTLRNVALTYPYMHDGRFFTLAQVLDHYASGVKSSASLDPSLSGGIPMTAAEKADIIAFLKTLTDYPLMQNANLQEPN